MGLFFGIVSLILLIAVLRRPWVGRGWRGGHYGHGGRWRGGWGPRSYLRGVMARLDTTPGQEKAIVAAMEEFKEAAEKLRADWKQARADVAGTVRGERFDAGAAESALGDSRIQELRKAAVAALGKVHEALDSRQRQALAEMIEGGMGHYGYGC